MDNKIYFNNCITSMPDPQVIDEMIPYLKEKFWYPGSFVSTGVHGQEVVDKARKAVALSLNAPWEAVHVTAGGSMANNIAIKGYLSANTDIGTHIICSVGDYPDILTNAAFFEQSGFEVTYLPIDEQGMVRPEDLRKAIRPDTVLFLTTHVNHTVGTIQPLAEFRAVLNTADHYIAMFVDGCQAWGRMPVDVNNPKVDLYSVSAHKIHGPQGVGALYVRPGLRLSQVQHGIARLDQLNTGGFSIAALAGMTKAIELQFSNLDENLSHIRNLQNRLWQGAKERIPHILLNGPWGSQRACHNLNFSVDFIEGEAVMMMMDMEGITMDTGSACASQGLKPNYILMAMGRTHVQSHGSLKFTLGRLNTTKEVDIVLDRLVETVESLRQRSPLYSAYLKENKER